MTDKNNCLNEMCNSLLLYVHYEANAKGAAYLKKKPSPCLNDFLPMWQNWNIVTTQMHFGHSS